MKIFYMLLLVAPLAYANLVITPAPPSPTVFVPGQRSPTVFVPGQQSPTEFARPSTNNRATIYLGNSTSENQKNMHHKRHFNYQHRIFTTTVIYPNAVVTTFGPTPVNNASENVDNRANWVSAHDGQVPDNAIPYVPDDNNNSANNNAFYCRGQFNNQTYDGVLVAGEGCYVEDKENAATIRLQNYEVLVP